MGVQQRSLEDPELVHHMLSAVRLARADRDALLGDPDYSAVDISALVDPDRAQRRAAQITNAALPTSAAVPAGQDTAALVVVDRHGNCVCLIQSLFNAFGSGLMVDGTGVLLNNRGAGFAARLDLPNAPAPGKRPLHTLHSCMVFRDGRPSVLLSTPGGEGQVQTHLQVLHAYINAGLTLQAAIELPRWFDDPATGSVLVESRFDTHVVDDLRARGYDLDVCTEWSDTHGGFQGAARCDSGWWLAADPRQDCWAIGY
jgi:gamma-glutamyltranspeptidase/glutathione hydrolase